MYFILAVLCMLLSIIALIFYKALIESLFPLFLRSEHAVRFKRRVSQVIYQLMIDMRNDFVAHMETICEHDGDEPFEPFLDSPLHTCPPTEFVYSPPKEEVQTLTDENNNGIDNAIHPRRRPRRRDMNPRPVVPVVEVIPPPRLPVNNPNPVVIVERVRAAQRINPHNLLAAARQLQQEQDRENRHRQNRVGPRRVLQLREMEELISPPPQQHNGNAFQFE